MKYEICSKKDSFASQRRIVPDFTIYDSMMMFMVKRFFVNFDKIC